MLAYRWSPMKLALLIVHLAVVSLARSEEKDAVAATYLSILQCLQQIAQENYHAEPTPQLSAKIRSSLPDCTILPFDADYVWS